MRRLWGTLARLFQLSETTPPPPKPNHPPTHPANGASSRSPAPRWEPEKRAPVWGGGTTALVILSLWPPASASHVDLTGHKAAPGIAPRLHTYGAFVNFRKGIGFFFSSPFSTAAPGTSDECHVCWRCPLAAPSLKSYKCFSVPSHKRLFILIPWVMSERASEPPFHFV